MTFWKKLSTVFTDRFLRKRILFIVFGFAVFRFLATIPAPGVDANQLSQILGGSDFLGLLNIFSGGGLTTLSLAMLGVGPYITASIVMQLLTVLVPRLKALYHDEGEAGKKKFIQYSRILTLPLAIIQGYALLALLQGQGIIQALSFTDRIVSLVFVVAGAMLITWIGELMSEFGIGNGLSLLIFAGIVAVLPQQIAQLAFTFDPSQIPLYLAFVVAALLVIIGVVYVNEAERPVPVTYAKTVRGGQTYGGTSTYLPLRVNQAGVMPIIFALSILLFPQLISGFLMGLDGAAWQSIGRALAFFAQTTWLYSLVYFILVFVFTFFYTAITFDSDAMATNLQKGGAFIPGVRPGEATSNYVQSIVNRITFVGALFLGLIAVLPLLMQQLTGVSTLAIGGTALLIVVSVIIDLIKKVDSQITMRQY